MSCPAGSALAVAMVWGGSRGKGARSGKRWLGFPKQLYDLWVVSSTWVYTKLGCDVRVGTVSSYKGSTSGRGKGAQNAAKVFCLAVGCE